MIIDYYMATPAVEGLLAAFREMPTDEQADFYWRIEHEFDRVFPCAAEVSIEPPAVSPAPGSVAKMPRAKPKKHATAKKPANAAVKKRAKPVGGKLRKPAADHPWNKAAVDSRRK